MLAGCPTPPAKMNHAKVYKITTVIFRSAIHSRFGIDESGHVLLLHSHVFLIRERVGWYDVYDSDHHSYLATIRYT